MQDDDPAGLTRRAVLATPLALAAPAHAQPQPPRKVLRIAFRNQETTFDPAKISDLYSRAVTAQIFEGLYGFDYLARPAKVVPVLADGEPEHSDDYRVWTVRLKRGVYFQDDPAFKGQRRELVAGDVLYAIKRLVDPANKSPVASGVLDEGFVGLEEVRKAALEQRKPFDYDAPVAGLQALDRYTVRFTLKEPRPRFASSSLTGGSLSGAQAREVVEFYGDSIGAHPVGTGPFRLKRWVRSSKIFLERNPTYREHYYDAQPNADDAEGQALLQRFKGRRLPMIDEVEIAIINEAQPLWLAFLNAEVDGLVATTGSVPPELTPLAAPNGHVAPHLARRGVRLSRTLLSDTTLFVFNMEDPVIGGLAPEKVALRRALMLTYDVERECQLIRRGQAVPAQSPMMPFTTGYDPAYKSPQSDYSIPKARALLDLYGYADRDGDGWRETPDGKPLVIKVQTEPEQIYRQYNDLLRRGMKEAGLKVEFVQQQWPENMKAARAGNFQVWSLGSSASGPDSQPALDYYYGPSAGEYNIARFKNARIDELYRELSKLPDGPEREKRFLEAKRIAAAYLPYRYVVHRIATEVIHPWLIGYRRGLFWQNWYHMVDVDPERKVPAA